MKAVILARVSTKEQEDGHSIGAQKQRLKDYCERKGLEVIRTFEIIESSTKGERKDFTAMVEFAKSQKETIAIVADAVDRFQRSFKESVMIDELRQKGKVELHFYRENMVISQEASSSDILRWDFAVMGAKSYVVNLSENVRRSMEFKRRNGEWGGQAPIGYINIRDNQNKSMLILDPERGYLIRRLFEAYATGNYSIAGDLVHMAKQWGLRNKTKNKTQLYGSQIYAILQNPFYYGEMKVKNKLYPHKYPSVIDKELFDRCQQVRTGTTRQQHVRYSEKPFIFRSLMKCAVSGRRVYCDLKKGKFVYLICRDPENPEKKMFVPEADVLAQVAAVFKSISVPPEILAKLTEHLKASHEAKKGFHKAAIENLRKEQDQNHGRLTALLDMRLDRSITQDEYDTKAHELKQRQHEIEIQMANHSAGDDSFRTTVESLFSIASQAYQIFESSKIEQKRQLIGFLFSNLQLRGGKLEFSLRKPFDLMAKAQNHSEWLAHLGGFEPPTSASGGQRSIH